MHRIIELDESTPLVALQFSFSNYKIVPKIIKKIQDEKHAEKVEWKKTTNGIEVISPTPNVSLLIFAKQLKEAGYELVDTIYQECFGNTNSKYHMVRFIFSRHECAKPSKNFQKYSDIVYSELDKICREALWRVRDYINPFYENGKKVERKNFISINMEVREPLFLSNGELIKRWEKDDKGNRIGRKLPLLPDFYLSAKSGKIKLIKPNFAK